MNLHYSAEQIAGFLHELEQGHSVRAVCARHGISPASLYAWKAKYGKPHTHAAAHAQEVAGAVKRLERELKLERGDIEVMRELFRKLLSNTAERREVVRALMDCGLSERQALRAIGMSASSFRYGSNTSPNGGRRVADKPSSGDDAPGGYARSATASMA